MIQAKELRIGVSWINWGGKIPVQFNGTQIYGEGQFEVANQKTMPQVRYGGYEYYQVSWDDLTHIPITPEILGRCGFVKDNADGKFYGNSFEPIFFIYGGWWGCDNLPPYLKFNSLHQLQNLYFALTGQELPINNLNTTN